MDMEKMNFHLCQLTPNVVRIILGVAELNRRFDLRLGLNEIKYYYLLCQFEDKWNMRARLTSPSLVEGLASFHKSMYSDIRENATDNFRAGKTWVLIATDVIARGMDFKGVNCVINYDFPDSAAAYIHRIDRTGRAGRSGEAITLYTESDVPFLRNIANVMAASGCEVPNWILSLSKKKWRKHRPHRESISTMPPQADEEE
ncbi:hypothetical protein LguiA_021941 [Lonicera macranthoides]